jgi:hypothetical protein
MSVMVVFESLWGNTRALAEAVAEGLGPAVTLLDVGRAPVPLPDEVDLLVVGGPTHAFSMSRASTRHDAETKGAPAGHAARGIREWLDELPESDSVDVATFDSRVGTVRRLPGSAAKAAAREVRRHRLGRLVATESFYVDDMAGPLLEGELDRARAWGESLALTAQRRTRRHCD